MLRVNIILHASSIKYLLRYIIHHYFSDVGDIIKELYGENPPPIILVGHR